LNGQKWIYKTSIKSPEKIYKLAVFLWNGDCVTKLRDHMIQNSILYIEGEKCMIFPKVQFVARGRSPRATKHRRKNEHSLQKYIYYFFHGRE
jgi:hypothetical protein